MPVESRSDPEKHVAELEHRLVEPTGAASHPFVAFAAPPTTKQMMKYTSVCIFAAIALLGGVNAALLLLGSIVGSERLWQVGSAVLYAALLLLARPAFAAFQRRIYRGKKVLIGVAADDLSISTRPGEVFSLVDAQLSRWALAGYRGVTKGTALRLRSGGKDLVIGGRDHRTAAGTVLNADAVEVVDAWMWPAEFDELLAVVGGRGELTVQRPTPGQPIRCLLLPNPMAMFSFSFFGTFKNTGTALQMSTDPPQPSMAIDLAENDISVIDLKSNTVIASAAPAQVTATPAESTRRMPRMGRQTTPVLAVSIPDAQPLSIGCADWTEPPQRTRSGRTKLAYRFSWRGEVHTAPEPTYVVSDADWLTLVEKLGLTSCLDDRAHADAVAAPLARPKRKLWIYAVIFAVIVLVAVPAMILVAGGIITNRQLKEDQLKAQRELPFALPFKDLRVPHGVAVDAAGNVYVADTHTNQVLKLAPGSDTQTVLPFTGLDLCSNVIDASVAGVAVDAAGSVYVSDSCNDRVVKLSPGSSTQTVLPFRGLDGPHGIAVDAAGAVYVVDYSHSHIFELAPGATKPIRLPATGEGGPSGAVAVDAAGNVYASCSRGRTRLSCLLRLAPGSNSWTRLPSTTDNSGDTFSSGEQDVAVDAAGTVYMITSRTVMKLAPGSDNWTTLPGHPPLVDPMGLAVDARGSSVYVTDHTGSRATGSGLPWEKDDAQGYVLKLPG